MHLFLSKGCNNEPKINPNLPPSNMNFSHLHSINLRNVSNIDNNNTKVNYYCFTANATKQCMH